MNATTRIINSYIARHAKVHADVARHAKGDIRDAARLQAQEKKPSSAVAAKG